jgi:hypothetical protein
MVLPSFSGCAGYFVGSQNLYRPDIYSVHVPVFESESFRRFLGERLTEAVVKQIELRTPYKVTSGVGADSVLTGRIISDSKYVITENINDEPRDLEYQMFVEVTWRDRNGQILFGPQALALPAGLMELGQSVHFVPEGGQSMGTAQLDIIEKLAEQIVSLMEVPW